MDNVRAVRRCFDIGIWFGIIRDDSETQSSAGQEFLNRRTPRDGVDGILATDGRSDVVLEDWNISKHEPFIPFRRERIADGDWELVGAMLSFKLMERC